MKAFVGFDCGTMGTKVGLYNIDGQCLAEFYKEIPITYPAPGHVEMNAMDFYDNVVEGIAAVIAKSGVSADDIKGISSCGIVDGTVPVDEDFNPVGPFIPYLDTRAMEEAAEIGVHPDKLWERESARSGMGADCVPMVLRWLYKRKIPYLEKTKKFCNIAPFVMSKLAGLKAKDAYVDWCHASGWCVGFNLLINDWSEGQFKIYGVPMDILPKVVSPWTVIGGVSKEMAAKVGLKAGTPLVAGSGDLMACSLGGGAIGPGQTFDVAGTASIVTFITSDADMESAIKNPVLITSRNVFEDELILWGCLGSGGLARGWYRDGILNLKGITQSYPMMDSLAGTVPAGSNNLLFSPYLTGAMTPSWPEAKGAWLGLTAGHNQSHLWRSLMESVAMEYKLYLSSMEDQGVVYDKVTGVGGGAKSAIWNQIKCDMLNKPYSVISTQDTGAIGNCLLAAYGSGHITDMKKTVAGWTEEVKTYYPREEYVKYYEKLFRIRQEIMNGPMAQIFKMWSQIEALTPPGN